MILVKKKKWINPNQYRISENSITPNDIENIKQELKKRKYAMDIYFQFKENLRHYES